MLQMVKLNAQRVSKLSQGCTVETRFEYKLSGGFVSDISEYKSILHIALKLVLFLPITNPVT